MKTIVKRMKRPTPVFFQQVRNVSLGIAGIGIAILFAPFQLPGILLYTAGCIALTGAMAAGVSQTAVKYERK